MKKKKSDYSILFHIVFLSIFIFLAVGLYIISGKKNVNEIVESTERVYQEKSQMQAVPIKKEEHQIPAFEKFSYKYTYKINVAGRIGKLSFKLPIPYDEAEKQYITENTFSIKPSRIFNDNNNTVAEFILENLNNESVEISLQGIANVRTYDYETASNINKKTHTEKDLSKYLAAEQLIESDDSLIKAAANKIKGNSQEEIVSNIYKYVVTNLKYTLIPGNIGAKRALQQKQGKCSEFSALMTALCRAKKIPARIVVGQIAREQNTKHNWVEVYYDKYGWVTYDPTERPTIITTYNQNGQIVKQESKIIAEKANAKYIASAKNQFMPWVIAYSVSEQANGTATVDEKFEIKKVQ